MKEAAKVVEEGGKIITIVTSLLAAFTGLYTSYAGSKAPVEHFTRGVAKELSGRRISVNAIGPGPMDTRTSLLCPVRIYCRSLLTIKLNPQHSSTLKNPTTLLRSTSPWRWRVV
jgi:NAD(P)-dependent dehydrogenase (short-subunit alcohol dehydrogenase family)